MHEGEGPLPRSFFTRDADVVARDLIGRHLVRQMPDGARVGRIVETEAYFGPPGGNPQLGERDDLPARLRATLVTEGDPAAHSYRGPTDRNRVMFGEAGHAYVYLIYGMHECMNVSTGPPGCPQAVLLRAVEPVSDIPEDARTDGPGRLTRALGVTRALGGEDLTRPPVFFSPGRPPRRVDVTPRVNVVGAEWYPLRFLDPASAHVSPVKPTGEPYRRKARKKRARERA